MKKRLNGVYASERISIINIIIDIGNNNNTGVHFILFIIYYL